MKDVEKILLRQYRKEHDCSYCLYYRTEKCDANMKCYLEETDKFEYSELQDMRIAKGCLSEDGIECPYGNEVGTCFGFCMTKILEEMRKNETKQEEQTYE